LRCAHAGEKGKEVGKKKKLPLAGEVLLVNFIERSLCPWELIAATNVRGIVRIAISKRAYVT
jgi:hypothetical protein